MVSTELYLILTVERLRSPSLIAEALAIPQKVYTKPYRTPAQSLRPHETWHVGLHSYSSYQAYSAYSLDLKVSPFNYGRSVVYLIPFLASMPLLSYTAHTPKKPYCLPKGHWAEPSIYGVRAKAKSSWAMSRVTKQEFIVRASEALSYGVCTVDHRLKEHA